MFQPKYTMNGFDLHQQRGIEGIGYVRALRSLLTSHLPLLLPSLHNLISDSLDQEIDKQTIIESEIPERKAGVG